MLLAIPLVMALVPSLLLMWYFHARDAYPEPPRVLWATFGLGVLSIIPTLVFALPTIFLLREIPAPFAQGFVSAFLSAAIPEELFKFLVLYLYCIRHPEFNEPMDGVVYGVAASLGFATLENVLYVSQYGAGNAILRAFTAVPMHAFCGALMGYFVGRGVFEPSRRAGLFFQGWLAAVAMHGLYDFPLLTTEALVQQSQGNPREIGVLVLGLFGSAIAVLVCLGVWAWVSVRKLRAAQDRVGSAQRMRAPILPPRPDGLDSPWVAPPTIAFDPHPPKPPPPAGSSAIAAWLLLLGGGILACGGGLLTLLMIVGIAAGAGAGEHPMAKLIGATCCVGVSPLVIGGVLFAIGVRMLNRP